MGKTFRNMIAGYAGDVMKILMLSGKLAHLVNPVKILNFTAAMKQINGAGMPLRKCIGQNTCQRCQAGSRSYQKYALFVSFRQVKTMPARFGYGDGIPSLD